jgi:hypothetical protein
MSRITRHLEALQWFGLFGGALAWVGQFVVGYGVGQGTCSPGGRDWGIGATVWEIALLTAAAVVTLLALAASVLVIRETRETEYDGTPPDGRRRFFAIAAAMGNVLFLAIILNTGIVSLSHFPCRQS